MKKNLSILICIILCTSFLHAAEPKSSAPKRAHVRFEGYEPQTTVKLPPTSTTEPSKASKQLSNIILVVKAVREVVKAHALQEQDRSRQEQDWLTHGWLTELMKEYPNLAETKELNLVREKIAIATQELIKAFNEHIKDNVQLKFDNQQKLDEFAQKIIQPCYEEFIQDPGMMAKLLPTKAASAIGSHILQIKPEFLKTETLKATTENLLYRIGHIWQITRNLFNIAPNQNITLTKPAATQSIKEWIKQTFEAAQRANHTATTSPGATAKGAVPTATVPALTKTVEKEIKAIKIVSPSPEKLKIVETLQENLADYDTKNHNEKTLVHELFMKNDAEFWQLLVNAFNFLQSINTTFQEKDSSQANQRIMLARDGFITTMNELYTILFKQKFDGWIPNQFLVIKHKFTPKAAISERESAIAARALIPTAVTALQTPKIIPPLPADQAVIALTELIMLWEIYQNLFANTEGIDLITLPYLQQSLTVSQWIYYTSHAGFTQKAEFSDELQASLNPLLPEPKKLSQALKDSLASLASTVKEKAEAATSWIANKGVALARNWWKLRQYVTRKAEKYTEKYADIPDEL